jgi:murein L,D-transpeptidase YcbB/YkuD
MSDPRIISRSLGRFAKIVRRMSTDSRRRILKAAPALAAVLLAFFDACAAPGPVAVTPQDLRSALAVELQTAGTADRSVGPEKGPEPDPKTVALYRARDMQPFWVTPAGPNGKAGVLRSVLAAADTQGLDPQDYAVDEAGRLWDKKDASSLARLEVLLTASLRDYASDLVEGRRQPRDFNPEAFPTACDCEVDAPALLEQALAASDLGAFLEDQAPPFEEYRKLRVMLAEYRGIAARGGWPRVPAGPTLKPGMNDPRLGAVRSRLAVTGEWPADDPAAVAAYDRPLEAAVRRFQRRHGLEPDGVIGPASLASMNVPVEARIRQIILSMENWRWVDRDPGDWWIEVNIPAFRLTAFRAGRVDLTMPVVVGDDSHMTPVFSNRLRYVEFNPYWNVPLSIAQKEFLPKLQADPAYLKRQHIRTFDGWDEGAEEIDSAAVGWKGVAPGGMGRYRFRQDPGPDNSLGHFAFIFPNPFDVYLHDTPALGLFGLARRTFSHGCIRVSRAHELAAYVLGGPDKGWTEEEVDRLLAAGKNQKIPLDRPLPVYILYNTAAVQPDDPDIFFYADVYGRDALLEKAIFPASAAQTAAAPASVTPPPPERTLSFYNTHNDEHLSVVYRRGDDHLPEALDKIKHILRDPLNAEEHPIDPGLLDFLYDLLQKAGYRGEVHIVCGYRCAETNAKLHESSGGVSRVSQHLQGRALDFRLPGFDTRKLYDLARAMKRGGTGYYQKSDFIQIDTGPVRSW